MSNSISAFSVCSLLTGRSVLRDISSGELYSFLFATTDGVLHFCPSDTARTPAARGSAWGASFVKPPVFRSV